MKTWINSNIRPPIIEDYGSFFHSQDVLITNGKDIYVGYLQIWENEEYPAVWKIKGRDGYTIDNITHWMNLPDLP